MTCIQEQQSAAYHNIIKILQSTRIEWQALGKVPCAIAGQNRRLVEGQQPKKKKQHDPWSNR